MVERYRPYHANKACEFIMYIYHAHGYGPSRVSSHYCFPWVGALCNKRADGRGSPTPMKTKSSNHVLPKTWELWKWVNKWCGSIIWVRSLFGSSRCTSRHPNKSGNLVMGSHHPPHANWGEPQGKRIPRKPIAIIHHSFWGQGYVPRRLHD